MIRVAATRHARPHLRARLRAAAEATAAKEQAEYERLIAEKENEMKQQETEEEKRRPQALAQHDRDIAVMSANKWVAAANARLKAIQESMLEREINNLQELSNMDITDCQVQYPKADDMLLSRVLHAPTGGHTHESPYTPVDRHTLKRPYFLGELGERGTPVERYTPVEGISQL